MWIQLKRSHVETFYYIPYYLMICIYLITILDSGNNMTHLNDSDSVFVYCVLLEMPHDEIKFQFASVHINNQNVLRNKHISVQSYKLSYDSRQCFKKNANLAKVCILYLEKFYYYLVLLVNHTFGNTFQLCYTFV